MSSTAPETVEEIAAQQGWTDATLLGLALDYIANQQDDEVFLDHLRRQADEEGEVSGRAQGFEMEEVRVVVTPRGAGDDERGVIVVVPAVQARPGKVIRSTNVVIQRMAWPHEYNLDLLAEVWV